MQDPQITEARRGSRALSLVWLVPIAALTIALGAAWRSYSDRGPLIEIAFANASGVHAGETELRYRDIAVGKVESVRFGDDLDRVILSVRISKEAAPFIDSEATFWIVRPEVTAQGVSGLDTVLSGVYIQGTWDNEPGEAAVQFVGIEEAPMIRLGERGTQFTLRSTENLPSAETPIIYKGVVVGRLGVPELSPSGFVVRSPAVVFEPYDALITSETRFWDISGFSFSLGAGAARLEFTSLASLISGGVTFGSFGSGGRPLREGMSFELYPNEAQASEAFISDGGTTVNLSVVFEDNIQGLAVGAPVQLGGLRVGEVTGLSGLVDTGRFGDENIRLLVTLQIQAERLGLSAEAPERDVLNFLDRRIAEGLRARLANASLITGGLKVELIDASDAAPARIDRLAAPYPALPSVTADVTSIASTAQDLLARVEALPVEELLETLIGTLADTRAVIASPGIQQAPEELQATLVAVRRLVESDAMTALPVQISGISESLLAASAQVTVLLEQIETADTLGDIDKAITEVRAILAGLPALAEEGGRILTRLTPLVDTARDAAGSVQALLADPALAEMPGTLRDVLGSAGRTVEALETIVSDAQTQALPQQLATLAEDLTAASAAANALMADLQAAELTATLDKALRDVALAAESLPALADEARALIDTAGTVPLDRLAEHASALMETARNLIGQQSTQDVPEMLNRALDSLTVTLDTLQDGDLAGNAVAALDSARRAAEAIADASADLPALSQTLSRSAQQAEETLESYSENSTFSRDLQSMLRQVEDAARAIDRLARQLQRDPSSLITGR